MPRRHSKTGKQAIRHAQRAAEALDLRRLGLSYRKIAEKMGLGGPSSAFKLVGQELGEVREATKEAAAEVRQLELERTELLWRSCMTRVASGDPKAITAAVAILKRRAAMLGLDQPQLIEHTIAKTYAVVDASPDCPAWPSAPASAPDDAKSEG